MSQCVQIDSCVPHHRSQCHMGALKRDFRGLPNSLWNRADKLALSSNCSYCVTQLWVGASSHHQMSHARIFRGNRKYLHQQVQLLRPSAAKTELWMVFTIGESSANHTPPSTSELTLVSQQCLWSLKGLQDYSEQDTPARALNGTDPPPLSWTTSIFFPLTESHAEILQQITWIPTPVIKKEKIKKKQIKSHKFFLKVLPKDSESHQEATSEIRNRKIRNPFWRQRWRNFNIIYLNI